MQPQKWHSTPEAHNGHEVRQITAGHYGTVEQSSQGTGWGSGVKALCTDWERVSHWCSEWQGATLGCQIVSVICLYFC